MLRFFASHLIVPVVAATLLLALAPWCRAAEPIPIFTENWPPYNYTHNDRIVGMSTELVEAIFTRAGLEYTIEVYPWARALLLTETTANAALYTTSRTKQREQRFKWVGPLFPRQLALFKLSQNRHIVVNRLGDLKRYRIGVLRGGSVQEYLQSKGFDKTNLHDVAEVEQNLNKLYHDRIDLIVGNETTLAFRMKSTPYSFADLEQVYTLIDQDDYFIALNRHVDDRIVQRLQTSLDALVEQGLRTAIQKKYLGVPND